MLQSHRYLLLGTWAMFKVSESYFVLIWFNAWKNGPSRGLESLRSPLCQYNTRPEKNSLQDACSVLNVH